MTVNDWAEEGKALAYLHRPVRQPHREEGEAVLLDLLPSETRSVLDVGAGDGALLALVMTARPIERAVALDFSPMMLATARTRFDDDPRVVVVDHDLDRPLPDLGRFDAVVSAFAIHHCTDERKRQLYAEVFALLEPGGVFGNLEHVSSPTEALHDRFLAAIGQTRQTEDRSNKLLDVETQLTWLRQLGYVDVDCHWKWLELALLAGVKPGG